MITDLEKGTLIESISSCDIIDITKIKIRDNKVYYNEVSCNGIELPFEVTKECGLQLWTRGFTKVNEEKALIRDFLTTVFCQSMNYKIKEPNELKKYYDDLLNQGNLNASYRISYSIRGSVIEIESTAANFTVFIKPASVYISSDKKYALAFGIDSTKSEVSIRKNFEDDSQNIRVENVAIRFLEIFLSAAKASQLVEIFVDEEWRITKVRFPAS